MPNESQFSAKKWNVKIFLIPFCIGSFFFALNQFWPEKTYEEITYKGLSADFDNSSRHSANQGIEELRNQHYLKAIKQFEAAKDASENKSQTDPFLDGLIGYCYLQIDFLPEAEQYLQSCYNSENQHTLFITKALCDLYKTLHEQTGEEKYKEKFNEYFEKLDLFVKIDPSLDLKPDPDFNTVPFLEYKDYCSENKSPGRTILLSIGINNYQDKRIKPLNFAENDSKNISDAFLEYSNDKVVPIRLNSQYATKENILNAIDLIKDSIDEEDKLVIFYSGHGGIIGNIDSNYSNRLLMPSDVDLNHLEETSISMNEISKRLEKFELKNPPIFLSDACGNQLFRHEISFDFESHHEINNYQKERSIAYQESIQDFVHPIFILSTRNGELSAESKKLESGVFSHFLVESLENQKKSDLNNDGSLSINELRTGLQKGLNSFTYNNQHIVIREYNRN